MDKPLISFLIASYNQEAFIREAVESAFAQSYSPLEIIISDDCSNDRTFEIAQKMAAAYQGPHSVRLNRNATNFGIGGHANRVMELCRGELLAAAAGDDVSMPPRAEIIYQAGVQMGGGAAPIFHNNATNSVDVAFLEHGG